LFVWLVARVFVVLCVGCCVFVCVLVCQCCLFVMNCARGVPCRMRLLTLCFATWFRLCRVVLFCVVLFRVVAALLGIVLCEFVVYCVVQCAA
jgi:hypothetical protein